MNDSVEKLYKAMSEHYALDMDVNDFKKGLSDDDNRKQVFDAISLYYDVGDFDSFSKKVLAEQAPMPDSLKGVKYPVVPLEAGPYKPQYDNTKGLFGAGVVEKKDNYVEPLYSNEEKEQRKYVQSHGGAATLDNVRPSVLNLGDAIKGTISQFSQNTPIATSPAEHNQKVDDMLIANYAAEHEGLMPSREEMDNLRKGYTEFAEDNYRERVDNGEYDEQFTPEEIAAHKRARSFTKRVYDKLTGDDELNKSYERKAKANEERRKALVRGSAYQNARNRAIQGARETYSDLAAAYEDFNNAHRKVNPDFQEGESIYVFDSDEARNESRLLGEALELQKKTLNLERARVKGSDVSLGSNGLTGAAQGFAHSMSDPDFWTFGLEEVMRSMDFRNAMNHLAELTKQYGDGAEERLSDGEQALITSFLNNIEVQARRQAGLSPYYTGGQIAAQAIPFMAQFALTGGVAGGVMNGVKNGLLKLSAKASSKFANSAAARFITESMGGLASTALRTVAMPSTYQSIAQRYADVTPDENAPGGYRFTYTPMKSIWLGTKDNYLETLSESFGAGLARIGLDGGHIAKIFGENPTSKWAQKLLNSSKTLSKAGYDGLIAEPLEEVYRTALGGLLTPEDGSFREQWDEFWKNDNLKSMMIGFLPMSAVGLGGASINRSKVKVQQRKTAKNYADERTILGDKREDLEYVLGKQLEGIGLSSDEAAKEISTLRDMAPTAQLARLGSLSERTGASDDRVDAIKESVGRINFINGEISFNETFAKLADEAYNEQLEKLNAGEKTIWEEDPEDVFEPTDREKRKAEGAKRSEEPTSEEAPVYQEPNELIRVARGSVGLEDTKPFEQPMQSTQPVQQAPATQQPVSQRSSDAKKRFDSQYHGGVNYIPNDKNKPANTVVPVFKDGVPAGFLIYEYGLNGNSRNYTIARINQNGNRLSVSNLTQDDWTKGKYTRGEAQSEDDFYANYWDTIEAATAKADVDSNTATSEVVDENTADVNAGTQEAQAEIVANATPEEKNELVKEMNDEQFMASLPRDKKGELDYGNFTPAQEFRYTAMGYGLDRAVSRAKKFIENAEATIAKVDPDTASLKDLDNAKALRARIDEYQNILAQYEQEVPQTETPAEVPVEPVQAEPVAEQPVQTPAPVAAAAPVQEQPAPKPAEPAKPKEKKESKPKKKTSTVAALGQKDGAKEARQNATASAAPVSMDEIAEDYRAGHGREGRRKINVYANSLDAETAKAEYAKAVLGREAAPITAPERRMNKHLAEAIEKRLGDLGESIPEVKLAKDTKKEVKKQPVKEEPTGLSMEGVETLADLDDAIVAEFASKTASRIRDAKQALTAVLNNLDEAGTREEYLRLKDAKRRSKPDTPKRESIDYRLRVLESHLKDMGIRPDSVRPAEQVTDEPAPVEEAPEAEAKEEVPAAPVEEKPVEAPKAEEKPKEKKPKKEPVSSKAPVSETSGPVAPAQAPAAKKGVTAAATAESQVRDVLERANAFMSQLGKGGIKNDDQYADAMRLYYEMKDLDTAIADDKAIPYTMAISLGEALTKALQGVGVATRNYRDASGRKNSNILQSYPDLAERVNATTAAKAADAEANAEREAAKAARAAMAEERRVSKGRAAIVREEEGALKKKWDTVANEADGIRKRISNYASEREIKNKSGDVVSIEREEPGLQQQIKDDQKAIAELERYGGWKKEETRGKSATAERKMGEKELADTIASLRESIANKEAEIARLMDELKAMGVEDAWKEYIEDGGKPTLKQIDQIRKIGKMLGFDADKYLPKDKAAVKEQRLVGNAPKATPEELKRLIERLQKILADSGMKVNVLPSEDYKKALAQVRALGHVAQQMTFHGTHALLEKRGGNKVRDIEMGFDHKFMGSGEGAQAYGWGTYLASNRDVANNYMVRMAQSHGVFNDEDWDELIAKVQERYDEYRKNHTGSKLEVDGDFLYFDPDEVIEKLEDGLGQIFGIDDDGKVYSLYKTRDEFAKAFGYSDAFDDFLVNVDEAYPGSVQASVGHLYNVDIPDDDGFNYLHWSAPITVEQEDAIADALADVYVNSLELDDERAKEEARREVNQAIRSGAFGGDIYGAISSYLGSDKAASEFLNSVGIIGVSVPARNTSGSPDFENPNYVIFDDNVPVITKDSGYAVSEEKDEETGEIKTKVIPLWEQREGGESAGFVDANGNIYINQDAARIDTPLHEIGLHAVARIAEANGYTQLKDAVRRYGEQAPQEFKDYVKENYPDLKEDSDDFYEEVAAHAFGQHYANRQKDYADANIWQRLLEAIRDFFRRFGEAIGMSPMAKLNAFEGAKEMGFDDIGKALYNLAMGNKAIAAPNGMQSVGSAAEAPAIQEQRIAGSIANQQYNLVEAVARNINVPLPAPVWRSIFQTAGINDPVLDKWLGSKQYLNQLTANDIIEWADKRYQDANPVGTGDTKVMTAVNDIVTYIKDNIHNYNVLRRLVEEAGGKIPVGDMGQLYTNRVERGASALDRFEEQYQKPINRAVAAILNWAKANGLTITEETLGNYLLALNAPARNKWITVDKAEEAAKGKEGMPSEDVIGDMYDAICLGNATAADYAQGTEAEQAVAQYLEGMKDVDARNWSGSDGVTSFDDDSAAGRVRLTEASIPAPLLASLRSAMHDASQRLLQMGVEYGFHDQQFVDECNRRYPDYAPFVDWADKDEKKEALMSFDGANFRSEMRKPFEKSSLNPQTRKSSHGRKTLPANPIAMMLYKAANTSFAGEENRARQMLYELVNENRGMSNLFYAQYVDANGQLVDAGEEPDWFRNMSAEERAKHAVKTFIGGNPVTVYINGDLGKGLHNGLENGANILRFARNEREAGHETIADVIEGVHKLNTRVTGALSQVLTTFNPAFPPVNAIRDVRYAIRQMYVQQGADAAWQFMKGIAPAFKECVDNMMGHPSQLFQEFVEDGGYIGYSRLGSPEMYSKDVMKSIERIAMGKDKKNVLQLIENALKAYANMFENIARFDAYKVAREKGMSRAEAAHMAHEVSTNLSRRGTQKGIGALYMFFNANLEGAAQQLRNLKNKDTRGRALASHLMSFGLSLISGMVLRAIAGGGDGDDDKNIFADITDRDNPYNWIADYVKNGAHVLPLGKNDKGEITGLLLHQPFMYRADDQVAENLLQWISGKINGKEFVEKSLGAIVDEYNPFAGTNLKDASSNGKWHAMPIPSAIRPAVDAINNRSSLGYPIYNEYSPNQAGYTREDYLNAKPGTNPLLVAASKHGLPMKPEALEYLLSSTLGSWWDLFDAGTSWAFGNSAEEMRYGKKKLPMVGRFYTTGGGSMYDRLDELKEYAQREESYMARMKDVLGEGENVFNNEYMENVARGAAVGASDIYKRYRKAISEQEKEFKNDLKVAKNKKMPENMRKNAEEGAKKAYEEGIRELNYKYWQEWEKNRKKIIEGMKTVK